MQCDCDALPCLYFSVLPNGCIHQANRQCCDVLGYDNNQLQGYPAERIFTVATRLFNQTHLYPLLQVTGKANEVYVTLLAKNGDHVPVLLNATKDAGEAAKFHFAGMVVKERQRFEAELLAAKKQAETALAQNSSLVEARQKLQQYAEALDKQLTTVKKQNRELQLFTYLATHHLQEPVRKLHIFSDLLTTGNNTFKPADVATGIHRSAKSLHEIIKGLQQYSWLQCEQAVMDTIDLEETIQQAVNKVAGEHPNTSIQLTTDGLPAMQGNALQWDMLFTELITNAAKFSKPNQNVNIAVTSTILKANTFRHLPEQFKYADILRLEIADNGIGIDEAYSADAFQMFRKFTENSGSGVGLALVKKIVENHDGTILLQGKIGLGTKVIIQLPLQAPSIPAAPAPV